MMANEIVKAFQDAITKNQDAHLIYSSSNPAWTTLATAALVEVARSASTGKEVRVAARGFKDPEYGRSEYLCLDVCAYDNATWGPPLFIAEHENSTDVKKIQYCAWKLLVTEASRRVLVAYYMPKVGFDGVVKAVREVSEANPGRGAPRDLLVIAAAWDAKPVSPETLRTLFESQIVGKL